MVLARQKGWIGVDVGLRTLKLAQVQRSRAGLRIATSVVMPRIDTPASGQDTRSQEVAWTPRELSAARLLEPGFSGRQAACVLPMCVTDLHLLTLPQGGVAEQRAMVTNELSSMISRNDHDREFEYWKPHRAVSTESSDLETVNVLSVSRRLVSQVVDNLSSARLSCQAVDGLPFVLARAVKMASEPGEKGPVAAVDWGIASTTFCVVSDGQPLFTRHLRGCGASLLTDVVSRTLGLREEEATRALATHGLPVADDRNDAESEIQQVIAEVTAAALNEMVGELRKTLSYIKLQYSNIQPTRLCLLGEGATTRNMAAFLAEKVGLPTEVWRMPGCGDCSPGDRIPEQPEAHPALLGAAAALSALAWT